MRFVEIRGCIFLCFLFLQQERQKGEEVGETSGRRCLLRKNSSGLKFTE